jgi:hypothetical protein
MNARSLPAEAPVKTRADRQRELFAMLATVAGRQRLCELYATHFRFAGRYAKPSANFMIARLLSVEFPDG